MLPGAQLPCEWDFLVDSRHDKRSDNLRLEDPEGGMKVPGSGVLVDRRVAGNEAESRILSVPISYCNVSGTELTL